MFIQFGFLQKKLLIPIIFPIFKQARNLLRTEKIEKKYYLLSHFNQFLGYIFLGSFYLIIKCKSKTSKIDKGEMFINPINKNINSASQIENDNLKTKKQSRKIQFLFILLISCIQLLAALIKNVWDIDIYRPLLFNCQVLIEIICLVAFSKCFLGFSIYSHQILSIIIILICLIIFFIESIIYHNVSFPDVIIAFIYFGITQTLYSLSNVLGKKYLNLYMDNVYLFLFKIGIINIIPIIIIGLIGLIINLDERNQLFQIYGKINIWIYFIDLFLTVLYEMGFWLTIYYFSPCHCIIFESISNFIKFILSRTIQNKDDFSSGELITFSILYPIFIFIALVFNEIIILNFCRLNYNTKKEIMKREKIDAFEPNSSPADINVEYEDYEFSMTNHNN